MPDRRSRRSSLARPLLTGACVAFGALVGCGPITSTAAINDARYALERAESVEAAERARYEYTSAEAYFDKAREEWARSDYQHALSFAERALSFAEAAYERAVGGAPMPEGSNGAR